MQQILRGEKSSCKIVLKNAGLLAPDAQVEGQRVPAAVAQPPHLPRHLLHLGRHLQVLDL